LDFVRVNVPPEAKSPAALAQQSPVGPVADDVGIQQGYRAIEGEDSTTLGRRCVELVDVDVALVY
jgi:hypothetical protein